MKKILLLIMSLLISSLVINYSYASSLENKLYKSVSITKIQIEKDYSKNVNKKIVYIFAKYRYLKDKTTLNKLGILLKNKIRVLNKKSFLTMIEKKKLNLYNNLYYRTILLLKYNLK